MVKFCETRFAQSELKVYINFEKNYNTYGRTWGAAEEEEQPNHEEMVVAEQEEEAPEQEEGPGDVDDWDEPVAVLLQREQERQQ
jgi:hypothetical protein